MLGKHSVNEAAFPARLCFSARKGREHLFSDHHRSHHALVSLHGHLPSVISLYSLGLDDVKRVTL